MHENSLISILAYYARTPHSRLRLTRELTTTKQQIIAVYARVGGTYGLCESRQALRASLSAPLPVPLANAWWWWRRGGG